MFKKISFLSITILFFSFIQSGHVNLSEKNLLGKWNWEYFLDSDGSKKTIEEVFMGLTSFVQTEFKEEGVYTEYKNRMGSEKVGSHNGWWKISGSDTIMSKSKDYNDFKPTKVLVFESDSMVYSFPAGRKLVLKKVD